MSKIFLLEDDLSLINGLSFAFKKQGFDTCIAKTLVEAYELWADGKYDLLVLDVSLPDGSGFEFCKKVRLASKVPIIFLTALVKELERCARKVGLFNFKMHASITAKPFFEKQGYTVEAENKVIRNGIALVNYKMVKNY